MAKPNRLNLAPIHKWHQLKLPRLLLPTQTPPLPLPTPTQQPRFRLRRRQALRLDLRPRHSLPTSLPRPLHRLNPRLNRLRLPIPFHHQPNHFPLLHSPLLPLCSSRQQHLLDQHRLLRRHHQ